MHASRTVAKVNYKAGIVGTQKSWQNAHQIRCFLKKGQKDIKASKSAGDFAVAEKNAAATVNTSVYPHSYVKTKTTYSLFNDHSTTKSSSH